MLEKLKEIKDKWNKELKWKYKGDLEIIYIEDQYYAYVYHNDELEIDGVNYDGWLDRIEEFEGLGDSKEIEELCKQLDIHVG